MISDFYTTVTEFIKSNKTAIDKLSFDKLQPDAVAVMGSSLEDLRSMDILRESIAAKVRAYKEGGTFDSDFEQIFNGNIKTLGLDEIKAQVNEFELEIVTSFFESNDSSFL